MSPQAWAANGAAPSADLADQPADRLAVVAQGFVGPAKLRFRNFREDLERVQQAAMEAMRNDQISKEDAEAIFMDDHHVVSLPLIQRYFEAQEFELVGRWLLSRMARVKTSWMGQRNRIALDGMIAGGESALAVRLLRKYLSKLREHTQRQWRAAGASRPSLSESDRQSLSSHLEIAEMELSEIESYLSREGSREDNRAAEKFRAELDKVRQRFGL